MLVNNVGLSYEFPAPFLEIEGGTNEFTADLVKCNITSVNTMTALVLPQVKNIPIFHSLSKISIPILANNIDFSIYL